MMDGGSPDWGSVIDMADQQQAQHDVPLAGAPSSPVAGTNSQGASSLASPVNGVAGTAPGAQVASDPWRNVIDQVDASTTQQAQLGLYAVRGTNPDNAAKAAQIGQQMGVPQPAVAADLPAWQQRQQLAQSADIVKSNPVLSQWLSDQPLAPAMAHDDLQNLDLVSRLARQWSSGWSGAIESDQLARLYYQGSSADPKVVAGLEASLQTANSDPAASGIVHGIAGMVAGLADLFAHATPAAAAGGVAGAGLGALAGGVGAVPGAAAGAGVGETAGVFSDAFKIGAGNIVHALDQVRDADGNRVNSMVGLGAAVLGGLANSALNTFGLHFGAGPAAAGLSAMLNDGIAQAVTRPSVAGALGKFALDVGKGGIGGAALGAAMEGSNVLLEETAKQLSTGDFQTVFNDPALRQEAVDRIAESAATMALTMGALHGAGGLPPLIADSLRARQAGDDAAVFQKLSDGAAASKVRGRSASLFQDFLQRQTDGSPIENLFIPAQRIAELYQSIDKQPGSADGLFGEIAPDIADQVKQGLATGGDVVVPTAGFMTHFAGTDISRQLQPDIRVRQDGMSLRDAQTFDDAYGQAIESRNAELQAQASLEAARVSSTDQIANDVRSQASAAGFGSDAAEQYAQLYAARYGARGERMGADPLDLYRGEAVTIQREGPDALPSQAPDGLDMLINAARVGKDGPPDSALYGKSLLQFLAARGGVEDPGGDLKAMGADQWHRGKPGTRRLVLPDRDDPGAALPGMGGLTADNERTPDAAARAAWEEGYFPEHADRPSVSDFYEAVRGELGGTPRYSEHGTAKAAEFRNAVTDLEGHLGSLGIDPAKATNAEIRGALAQHGEDGGSVEYGQNAARPPVASIRGDEIAPAETALPDLRKAAREFYDRELRGQSVHSAALDRDVEFRGSRKAFSASANPDKLRLFAALRDIIAKGDLITSEAPREPASESAKVYHYLEAPVDIGGRTMRVGVTVREDANGHLYYNHSPQEEGGAVPGAATQDTASKAGPGSDGAGTTHDQNVVPPGDGVNMEVHDPAASVLAQEGAQEAARRGEAPAAAGGPETGQALATAERRGSVTLSDGQAVIRLFAKRDMSTLLHESGHLWLDELVRDAASEDAPQQVRDDLAAVMRWMGVDAPEEIGTDQHEQFARGFEAYLMEGKAPSLALRGAFSRFKAWLLKIYQTVSNLRAPIDPTIRGVFDRLLASDGEIERVRQTQGLGQLFRTADDAGMTDAEFKAYTATVERARSGAADGLTQKVMGDVRRQRTAEWREQEAPIREDVTQQVDQRPDIKALRFFRTGKLDGVEGPGQRIRLDRQTLVDDYGSESALSLLPRRVPPIYSDTGGMHPDLIAEMLGMRSGHDLVDALMTHEAQRRELLARGDKRTPRQYAIDDATYQRMVDRHGDAMQDGSIESDALDHVHSVRQGEVLGAELKALGRRTGQVATPTELARRWADRTISEKLVRDGSKPGVFLRAEGKAGNAAMRALLAGDHAEAFRQKQMQLLNHSLYLSAKAARDDVAKGSAVMARFGAKAEFPTIDGGFVDRIHDLLRRFGLPMKRNPAELDRALGKTTLEGWATQKIADGHEIYIAPDLYDGTFAQPAGTLTVGQFRDLADTIRSIAHVGRDQQQVVVDGVKADRAETVQQMVAQLQDLPQRPARGFENQGGRPGARGVVDTAVDAAERFHAMLLKPEAIIDRIDAEDPNGVFNKAIWRPIKEAQATENALRAELVQRFNDLRDVVGKDYGKDFDRTLPAQPELIDPRTGEPMALKKRGLIGIALNVGNESNLQRLLDGYGWSADGVKAVLDRNLNERDWQFVQGTWDSFESLFPRIEAMQRRMTGVGLDKVEPREVETPFGTQRGGYYPVLYDPNLSLLGDRIKAAGDQRFEADYQRATTAKGHTIARVDNVQEPLSLDPDNAHWKLSQAVHDLAYREAIVQADKLLRDRRVMTALDGSIGRDQRKQLDSWLQGIANERNMDTRGLAAMDAFLHRLRTNTTIVGIGFRGTTMLKHGITALSNSIGELGPTWLLRGSTEFFGSWDRMQRTYAMVTAKSAEMRYRMDGIDRDVRESLQELQGKNGVVPAVVRFSHYGVATLDMGSAMPTWLGAYRRALAGGMDEGDAVAAADKVVRNAHGAGGSPDLAAIQRGSEAQKLFTQFYSFFNHIYNRQARGVQAARSGVGNVVQGNFGAAGKDFAKVASTFFFYLAVPAIIEGLVSQGGPGDDESWMGWVAKQLAGEAPAGIPVLRDVAKAAISGRSYELSPVANAIDTAVKTARDAAAEAGLRTGKNGEPAQPSDRALQHAIETAGYALGLPLGQPAGTAQFLYNVSQGQENPQSVADYWRGAIYGPAPKHGAK